MPIRRRHAPDAAARVLARARDRLVDTRASFEARVRELAQDLRNPSKARDVGRVLDEIAHAKLYRLGGHRTFHHFVREALGISRPTAHRLRTLARAPASLVIPPRGKTAAYEAARVLVRDTTTRRSSPPGSRARPRPRKRPI